MVGDQHEGTDKTRGKKARNPSTRLGSLGPISIFWRIGLWDARGIAAARREADEKGSRNGKNYITIGMDAYTAWNLCIIAIYIADDADNA